MKKLTLIFLLQFLLIFKSYSQIRVTAEDYYKAVKLLATEIDSLRNPHFKAIDSIIESKKAYFTLHEKEDLLTINKIFKDSLMHDLNKSSTIKSFFKKHFIDMKDERKILDHIHEALEYNWILKKMISCGVIKKDSITSIKEDGKGYKVLNTLNPMPNETIADIGAGSGHILFILNKLDIPLQLYYNEISEDNVKVTSTLYKKLKKSNPDNTITFVKGKAKSTKLEKVKIDKCLMINTLHHFDNADAMMKSLRKSFHHNSELLLIENPKGAITDDDSSEKDCPRALPIIDINIAINQSGFRVTEKYELYKGMFFWKVGV